MEHISREEAREKGQVRYWSDDPCKNGHIGERYVKSNQCLACRREYKASPKYKEWCRKYYKKNKNKIDEYNKQYLKDNPERMRAACRRWSRRHPDRNTFKTVMYDAQKMRRTPTWLTEEQKKEIKSFYAEAKRLSDETGVPHEVDHIIPLRGKNVSGLHVPWNLQVITRHDNQVKGNNF